MPLGMEVNLDASDIVLDGDPARPPQKGGRAPSANFRPMSIVANGCMDQDVTWPMSMVTLGMEVWKYASAQATLCKKGTQLPVPKKGAQPPPNFQPMFVEAKRLDGSRCHLVRNNCGVMAARSR